MKENFKNLRLNNSTDLWGQASDRESEVFADLAQVG